jgi:hypothetical protein
MDVGAGLAILKRAGVVVESGLAEEEFLRVEGEFGFMFPPDLRAFLGAGLPVGERWVDWRDGDRAQIQGWLDAPLRGMCFDIRHDSFWLREWGTRPADVEAACAIARAAVAAAPRLIVVYGHRYLPERPSAEGNPVLSVVQTDIVYYGVDLLDYLENEFGRNVGKLDLKMPERRVEFWSGIVEGNGER